MNYTEQAKAKWDSDSKLRAEFQDDFECWAAYFEANAKGLVRVWNGKKSIMPKGQGGSENPAKLGQDSKEGGSVHIKSGKKIEMLSGEQLRDKARAAWESDPTAKKDFNGDFDAFSAWFEANERGLIKSIG